MGVSEVLGTMQTQLWIPYDYSLKHSVFLRFKAGFKLEGAHIAMRPFKLKSNFFVRPVKATE